MAKDSEFCLSLEARHIQPTMLLSSFADLMKSDWVVTSVATRLKDRHMEVVMQCGGRTVKSAIDPEETVLRKCYRSTS